MKRFAYSFPGKLLAVLLFVLTCCLFAASTAAVLIIGVRSGYRGGTTQESFTATGLFCNETREDAVVIAGALNRGNTAVLAEYSDTRTNLRYRVKNADGEVISFNCGEDELRNAEVYNLIVLSDGKGSQWIENNYGDPVEYFTAEYAEWYGEGLTATEYTVECALPGTASVNDKYAENIRLAAFLYTFRKDAIRLAVASAIALLLLFADLMRVSGRVPDDSNAVVLGILERVPFDLLVVLSACAVGIVIAIADEIVNEAWGLTINLAAIGIAVAFCAAVGIVVCMSMAARIKARLLLKTTLIATVLRFCGNLIGLVFHGFTVLPLLWKTCLLLGTFSVLEFMGLMMTGATGAMVALWFLEKLVIVPGVLYLAWMLRKLSVGGKVLAEGDLNTQLDKTGLIWEFAEHAGHLNSIGSGMTKAVEHRMKSERMKTELITNVSHDIKTPLTSIINYVDLIEKEPSGSEKIPEYAAVLHRQADRLKRLLEDLVEASRASTGNIELHPAPCDTTVLVGQIVGEYEEKLEKANLTPVVNLPPEPVLIMADGRRLWRVFDNLMNNICKYALPGTRVYITLAKEDTEAVFTFRNISREQLNLSPDELMERFTRGDSSRNTEGSGLGLSIARSLTELQNGTIDLETDGDLFKAVLRFPIILKQNLLKS